MGDPQLSWDLAKDVRQLFDFQFMVNAYRAGTIVAIMAGLIGWFMVLRRQTFAGHTLALVGFPGASGAVLIGVSATYGYFAFAIVTALVVGVLAPRSGRAGSSDESAIVGTIQAFALASGFLFVSLSSRNVSGVQSLLFGSFIGITDAQVLVLLLGAVAGLVVLSLIARPLLFASVDPDVATARGVPSGGLSIVFLLLLGLAAAEASQVTGSLLVFALLVLPAATAERLTARPAVSVVLTLGIALLVTWLALALAYYSDYPIGFYLTSLAFASYLLALGWRTSSRRLAMGWAR